MAADVKIEIAAEYTGKKAFDKAEKQVTALTRQVKQLAGAFGVTFGAAALARYGQNAVRAFAGAELEVAQLNNSVRNLGLAFASKDLDVYLNKIEAVTGINRNQLQPAMLKLLQVTGSVEKSQELLNLSMDVAAGTGQDLASTSEKLAQAYVGNFKGLRSLNLGLTQAELKSTNFEEVQKRLQVLFAGQAQTAASSYTGSLNKLAVASENASEKIGKSLLDALTAISGGKTVDDTVRKIDTLSSAIAGLIDVTVGLKAGEYLQQYYALKDGKIAGGFGNRSMSVLGQDTQKSDLAARKKAEADAAKRAKQLLAMQNAAIKAQKDAFKLTKAKSIFDSEKIQIEAALKGKLTEEERIRLKLMKAIADENADAIDKLLEQLKTAQTKTVELQTLLTTIKTLEVQDPFGTWKIDPLTESINKLTESIGGVGTKIQANGKEWSSFATLVASTSLKPNLGEWTSSFSGASKTASEAIAAQTKAAQDAAAAQIKAAQEAAAAQLALLTAGSAEQKAALEAQLKAQSEALAAQAKAQLEALQKRLADEAAAYKEAAEAAAAAAQAALLTGANDYTTAALAKIASEAAAQAAAAAAAQAAADQAAGNTTVTGGGNNVNITVNTGIGDPNAIAEQIQQIIEEATQRGTIDFLGIA